MSNNYNRDCHEELLLNIGGSVTKTIHNIDVNATTEQRKDIMLHHHNNSSSSSSYSGTGYNKHYNNNGGSNNTKSSFQDKPTNVQVTLTRPVNRDQLFKIQEVLRHPSQYRDKLQANE